MLLGISSGEFFFAFLLNQATKNPKIPPCHLTAYLLPLEIYKEEHKNTLAAHTKQIRAQEEETAP